MTTIYNEKGALNVTLIECDPNVVALVRTPDKDGYSAIQLETAKSKKRVFRKEFRVKGGEEISLKKGDKVTVDNFQEGDEVKISGISKAKGFQGVMKRHGFSGSPKSHGHKHDWRAPGSIGSGFPEHVLKGKRMAGRMGGERSSIKKLEVVYLDKTKKIIGVKGAVPGVAGRIVEIIGA